MSTQHWSDCAIYNAPAFEPGECDCGWVEAEAYVRRVLKSFNQTLDEETIHIVSGKVLKAIPRKEQHHD